MILSSQLSKLREKMNVFEINFISARTNDPAMNSFKLSKLQQGTKYFSWRKKYPKIYSLQVSEVKEWNLLLLLKRRKVMWIDLYEFSQNIKKSILQNCHQNSLIVVKAQLRESVKPIVLCSEPRNVKRQLVWINYLVRKLKAELQCYLKFHSKLCKNNERNL